VSVSSKLNNNLASENNDCSACHEIIHLLWNLKIHKILALAPTTTKLNPVPQHQITFLEHPF